MVATNQESEYQWYHHPACNECWTQKYHQDKQLHSAHGWGRQVERDHCMPYLETKITKTYFYHKSLHEYLWYNHISYQGLSKFHADPVQMQTMCRCRHDDELWLLWCRVPDSIYIGVWRSRYHLQNTVSNDTVIHRDSSHRSCKNLMITSASALWSCLQKNLADKSLTFTDLIITFWHHLSWIKILTLKCCISICGRLSCCLQEQSKFFTDNDMNMVIGISK
jgi:hypothetical protein